MAEKTDQIDPKFAQGLLFGFAITLVVVMIFIIFAGQDRRTRQIECLGKGYFVNDQCLEEHVIKEIKK